MIVQVNVFRFDRLFVGEARQCRPGCSDIETSGDSWPVLRCRIKKKWRWVPLYKTERRDARFLRGRFVKVVINATDLSKIVTRDVTPFWRPTNCAFYLAQPIDPGPRETQAFKYKLNKFPRPSPRSVRSYNRAKRLGKRWTLLRRFAAGNAAVTFKLYTEWQAPMLRSFCPISLILFPTVSHAIWLLTMTARVGRRVAPHLG